MRGLLVLKALGQRGQAAGLAELARAIDLPKPSLLRLLTVMEREGFVARFGQPPVYGLGPSVYELAESLTPLEVSEVTGPVLKALADELGFTSNLGVLKGRSVLHLNVEEPARALRLADGGFLDHTYCTGLGKMLLSALDAERVSEHVPSTEPYERFTERTLTSRRQLNAELAKIRERGFSIDDEERNRGVRCMAILVPLESAVALSLSVSGPSGELAQADEERIYGSLQAAAVTLASLPRLSMAIHDLRTKIGN